MSRSNVGSSGRRAFSILGWLAVAMLMATALLAPTASAAADGNNGTAKIHEGASHADPPPTDRNNQPHVCTFHIHGFNFDEPDTGVWRIYSWPPTGNRTVVRSGQWAGAEWQTDVMTLPDGHYRLVVNITGDSNEDKDQDYTADKHKEFWVDCESEEQPGEGSPIPSPSPSGEVLPSGAPPSVSPSPSPSPSPSGEVLPSGAPPSVSPSPSPSGEELPGQGSPSPSPSPSGGVLPTVAPPSASPSEGGVLPTTGTPSGEELPGVGGGEAGVTPPATDTVGSTRLDGAGETWRLALLALAVVIASVLILLPQPGAGRR